MSEQDRKDWNEDMEFDSLADDNPDEEIFDDSIIGFADYEDDFEDMTDGDSPMEDSMVSDYDDGGAAGDTVADDPKAATAMSAAASGVIQRGSGVSVFGVGTLFVASVAVSAIAAAASILLATGTPLQSLWQPANFRNFDQLLNFSAYPANIFYMVMLGVVFLAVLGSVRLAKTVHKANARTREAETMLDRLTNLSLENQGEWMAPSFKSFPPAEVFVTRVLGAFRLQEARQMRLMGLEGELHRLQKALSVNSRSDLTGRFDHPSAGALADEMVRYFDDRDAAVKEAEAERTNRYAAGGEFLEQIQDARRSNVGSLEKTATAGTTVNRLAGNITELVKAMEIAVAGAGSLDNAGDMVENIRQNLERLQTAQGAAPRAFSSEFNDMVDRGNKLAFQIAMEVTRLGPRGERLLPMTKALEELSAEFREVADSMDAGPETKNGTGIVWDNLNRPLTALAELLGRQDNGVWRSLADKARETGPAAASISQDLAHMADGFQFQDECLSKLGDSFAALTGNDFDRDEVKVPATDVKAFDTIEMGRQNSFAPAAEMKPFATPAASRPFHGQESILNPAGFELGDAPADDAPLSGSEEKVYDLDTFGASPLDTPVAETPADEVYELSDFGASPLDTPVAVTPADEVYELSDFGASPLDTPAAETPADEVYELSDFGASPLDAPASDASAEEVYEISDLGGQHVEVTGANYENDDGVFDLADFGAKPLT